MFSATDLDLFDCLSIKRNPEEVYEMREKYDSFLYQPYIDKNHWN